MSRPFRHTYRCARCDKSSRFDRDQLQAVGFAALIGGLLVRVLCFEREDTGGILTLILIVLAAVIGLKTYFVRLHPPEKET